MPEISRFFGIIIAMHWEDGERHHKPHIHARYQEHEAVYSIVDPIERLAGSLPRKQNNLVIGWIEVHQIELLDNWHKMMNDEPASKIKPLR